MAVQVMANEADPIGELIGAGQHREALAACARAYGQPLGRLCMAFLGSQGDAEEAVQETLLAAHAAFAGYRGDGTVKAFLYGIARRVCARRLEGRRRDQRLLEVVPTAGEAHDAFTTRQRARLVRDALVLRYVADLSHREIGVTCNIDEAAARKRVSRALDALRTLLPAAQEFDQ